MSKYILTFLCIMCSLFNVCEAQNGHLAQIGYMSYSIDTEHYEKLNEKDYYMYIEVHNTETKDACVLHIMTNREDNTYIVTDSIVRTHHGFMKSYSEYEQGTYNETSVIGRAIELLDKHEAQLKEESKV